MPRGRWPTATVFTTARVAASMTVTSLDFSLVTNTRTSAHTTAESPGARTTSTRSAPTTETSEGSRRLTITILPVTDVVGRESLSTIAPSRRLRAEEVVDEPQQPGDVGHAAGEGAPGGARARVVKGLEDEHAGAWPCGAGETEALGERDGVVVGA